ncbi:phage tail tip fiber protein [Providencia rettgeri]|uniref:Fibronectin type III protein n=2 Tax=Gammaproteobacteria TaxID=1236 RepID=A0A9N8D3W2_PRORE|nr:phage tail protein [Providencia rettgeri]CAB5644482.1 Fibronectin type III protein [Providencia rettgeri]CAB5710169.1 Fibronectin type III protein [Providencia rettgeri]CAC9185113.1 Fibronectin type III protein [Providencia rettgeri]CAC9228160.1 Fibronectin type III protein [Providencia rettgeri]
MSSGGGKAKTPILLNDNLKSKQFLRVLDLISEGPIYGPVDTEHMSSIMLNKTPVTNKNGDISINGVAAAWRNGSEYQEPINGFDYLESTVMVNNAVTKETPLVRTITNQEVDRVRLNIGVSSLVKTDSSGNQENSSVQMAIEVKSGNGGYVTQKIVTIGPNKISGEYLEAHIIEAPEQKPFDLRVRRITEDSNSDSLQNGTIWNSYTEITDDRLSHPFSAIVGVVIDRDQFKDTPTRNYHYRGLIVDVPDNYDPINRTYNGVWLGGFKQAWTNNPAWLYRALIKNNRYGLAKRVGFVDIDDGRLYALSQFCDQLVNDSYGGKEPRFTLNAYLTSQEKAKVILDKIASSLRGSSVWDGSYFSMLIDMPSDPVALITNSNVIDGKFTRNSTPSDERYNAVIVSWVDPNNGWETSKEYVADDVSIANDGYKETTIEAFGCTSRGQAHRVGKWLLETSLRETGRISFSMARDAISFMPCDIVEIADNQHIGTRVSGRVISRNKRIITVDAPIEINEQSITFSMMGAHGKPVKFDVDYIDGNKIHLLSEPEYFKEHSPFVISAKNLKTKLYRITSVKEEEGNGKYKISAAEHNPNKQAIVDEGAVFGQPTNTINGYRAPSIERLRVISVNSPTVQTTVAWESSTVAKDLSFEVRVYSNNGNVVFEDETSLFSYDFFGLNAGNYFVGVKAKIINGMKGAESQIEMNIGAPPKPTHIQIDSMHFALKATPHIATDNSINTQFEFWGSEQKVGNANDIEIKATRLGRGTFWIKDGLKEGQEYWFYIRSINPFGVSDFIEATGKPDNIISDVINDLGDTFLTTEAGQIMQEQIDFNKDNLTDLKIDSDDFRQKVISIDRELEAVNEAVMEVVHFSTENYYELKEESAKGKASIKQLQQVQADFTASQAKYQQEVAAQFEHTAADVLNVQNALAKSNEAFAEDIRQVRADLGETNDEVGTVKGRVTTVETATVDLKQAQAKQEQSVAAEFGEMRGYLTHLGQVTTDDNKALVEAIGQTQAQFLSLHNESLVSRARIIRTETALATETEARAEDKVQIDARFNDAEGAITTIKEVQAQQGEAIAKSEEQLRAEINLGDEALQGQLTEQGRELSEVSSVVTEHKSAIADLDKTVTQVKQTQQSQYNETKASINELSETTTSLDEAMATEKALTESRFEETEASISSLQQTVANIEGATVEAVGQLQVQHDIQGIEVLSVKASIRRVETVIATETHALAQKVEQLDAQYGDMNSSINSLQKVVADNQKSQAEVNELIKSEIGDNKAAIEKRAETSIDQQGNSRAYFSIKAGVLHNGQYYDVKMMMSAQVKNGQVVTQIAFAADEFIIFNNANGQFVTPFAVVNGQVFIGSGFIQDGSITNAKIGNVIQSNDFKKGEKGWQISKNGNPEFNDGTFRGKINATSGSFSNVVIEKNCDVKGTIYAENMKGNIVTVTKDIYINKSWQGTQVVELFKVMKRTQKCYVWVQGALNPTEKIPSYTGVATPNRSALAYRAPRFIGQGGECDIYVDNVKQPRPITYNIDNTGDIRDTYAVNEFVVDVPAGEGAASIGISIPHNGGEWTRFIMRARVIVFPSTDEVTF